MEEEGNMSVTLDNQGWFAEANGIYYPNLTFGPFSAGEPRWIVLHGTACNQCLAVDIGHDWAALSFNGKGQASTHLIIDKDGTFVQGLSCLQTAWGNSGASDSTRAEYLPTTNLNFVTISIEHCKYDAQLNSDLLTLPQQVTSFAVVEALCNKYNIPKNVVTIDDVSNGGIIRHRDCDNKYRWNCPGPYPFQDLANFLRRKDVFSDALCIIVWDSFFNTMGHNTILAIPPRDTGIFNEWRSQWIAGNFKGACLGWEYATILPNGHKGVGQNFGGGTCLWDSDAKRLVGWL
jgi:N-acetylmuramoyl-L-alanine amidase